MDFKKRGRGKQSLEMDNSLKKMKKSNGECYVNRRGKVISERQTSLPCLQLQQLLSQGFMKVERELIWIQLMIGKTELRYVYATHESPPKLCHKMRTKHRNLGNAEPEAAF